MSSWLWLPWIATMSVVLVVVAVLAWRRGRRGTAVRLAGCALLPWAAWLLGLVSLVARVTDAFVDWGARFVFSPLALAGLALGVVALAMIALGGRLARNRRSAPAVTSTVAPASEPDDDIEALLRKHGIT